jgi:TetR/AcrR family transcriptional regulator, transcriptional repressor for nem operon
MMDIMYDVKHRTEIDMKVSREQVAANRQTILEAAGHLFRARGFEGVTVSDVMKAAGLTHGGFYGYFKSKDDLIAQTLAHVSAEGPAEIDLARYAESYLSQRNCQNVAGGCSMAALGSETTRQTPEARAAMTKGLRQHLERLSKSAKGKTAAEKRRAAIGSWAAMVGAMIMARFSDDPKLSEELLAQTRAWIAGAATPRGSTVAR